LDTAKRSSVAQLTSPLISVTAINVSKINSTWTIQKNATLLTMDVGKKMTAQGMNSSEE